MLPYQKTFPKKCSFRSFGRMLEPRWIVVENLRAETHRPDERLLLIVCAYPRTVSPSTCSCPASEGLRASFWLAPCLVSHHEDLRPPGGQDARCVRSTSATRTNCVHSHLVRSRLHCRGFRRVGASRSLGSERLDRGTERFHGVRIASADRRGHNILCIAVV
jgi:hypothetical protein